MTSTLASIPSGIIWTPPQLQQASETSVVQRINFACYPPHYIDDPPTKRTNHWVFFLQLGASESLLVNPKPANMTNKLQLEVALKQYPVTNGALLYVSLVPVQGLRVKDIFDLIRTNGLDKYIFDSDGNGCRYWVSQFKEHLNRAGRVASPQEFAQLEERLRKTWAMGANKQIEELKPPRGVPASPGSFYQ